MAVKATTWRIKGMNRDADPSVFSNEYAYENRNIRITASSDSTFLGISNIKGTKRLRISNVQTLEGVPIGTAVISKYLVLFTVKEDGTDYIYRITFDNDKAEIKTIAQGKFNFSKEHPIETIPYWEATDVINVYWTDGINQIRKINIIEGINNELPVTSVDRIDFISSFDSVPIKDLKIEKQYSVGSFPSGVIQYFITAYNKFGNETNILYESPLYYMSPADRGGTADESNVNSFKITVTIDTEELKGFSHLRVYSTHRTSLNSDVAAYIVKDVPLTSSDEYVIIDTGSGLESIDPASLLYKEREPFSAGTFSQKDNVLFVGDVILLGEDSEDFKKIREYFSENNVTCTEQYEEMDYYSPSGVYPYKSNLDKNNLDIKGFKCHEYYKIGLQFQRKTGEWTSVIPLKFNDHDWIKTTKYPYVDITDHKVKIPKINIKFNGGASSVMSLIKEDYIAARAVIAEPILGHKSIRCQGILCPTLYRYSEREDNSPYSISSWFIRPCNSSCTHDVEIPPAFSVQATIGDDSKYTADVDLSSTLNSEIQGTWHISPYRDVIFLREDIKPYTEDFIDWELKSPNYIVDQNVLTFHSPDITEESINGNYNVRIVGLVPLTANQADYVIQTSTPVLSSIGKGKIDTNVFQTENLNGLKGLIPLTAYYLWNDAVRKNAKGDATSESRDYVTFAWHRSGSLNNDRNIDNTELGQSAILKRKIFSNLSYSYFTTYFNTVQKDSDNLDGVNLSDKTIEIDSYVSNEAVSIRVNGMNYMGNVDTLSNWEPYNDKFINGSDITKTKPYERLVDGYPINISRIPLIDGRRVPVISSVSEVYGNGSNVDDLYEVGIEPVSIKFKSTPHLVFQLPVTGVKKTILPAITGIKGNEIAVDTDDRGFYITNKEWKNATKIFCHIDYTGNIDSFPSTAGDGIYFVPGLLGWHLIEVKDKEISCYDPEEVYAGDIIVDTSYGNMLKVDSVSNGGTCKDYVCHSLDARVYMDQSTISISNSSTGNNKGDYNVTVNNDDYTELSANENHISYLYMAEIYEDIKAEDIYGTDYQNIRWDVASDPLPIDKFTDNTEGLLVSGDTYFQRWDCLKTYSFTNEDPNSVVDIVSFMVETPVNIMARTDRNRGVKDNTVMSPQNFNLYNEVYNQSQDFISNTWLEDSDLVNNNFPNTIYWSLAKTLREEIDTWAAITLSNSLDMDGDKGRVNAIRRLNNDLIVFQDTGIANILYNENMQIASTTGVPIEIANSGLVSGKRYLSNTVGCENKWSIVQGEDSLYFMDNYSKGIYKFNGQLTNLTSNLGFNSWADDNIYTGTWIPGSKDQFLAEYDKQNKEVHFMNSKESLVYSEQLGLFMTFMDIKNTPFMANIQDRVIMTDAEDKLYAMNEGDYSSFFETKYPFYTQVIANPEPNKDKIFNVLEYRADALDENHKATDKLPFHTLRIWNEYQDSGDILLNNKEGHPSNLKKKFRIWRVNNFRDKNKVDRIRNPWVFFKLSNKGDENQKVILHDMMMYYYE